ncbi:ROK family protein (putative glucokinase) [Caldanaerovirga acetigignens]|uniref:ROK family protein (Putative glucokinase) n=2 Tax=Caldanaerovirga acetigignens TaxID=447595 RepID=A0A1M7GL10_9FIRM|nr:ROK family protein (putative glucokinase) [Caldanaerovirga acetigignens]
MRKEPGNSKYVKKVNRMTVLNLIRKKEVISRQELAEITGLTPPAITGIIRELLDMNLVKEVGLASSRGGRRAVKLKFNSGAGHVLGIEVTRFETTIGVSDLKNLPEDIESVEMDLQSPEEGVPLLIEHIKNILTKGRQQKKNFIGVGVAFPGLLNVKKGIVERSVNLGPNWNGYPIKDVLEKELQLPVFVENNSNASALAERCFGGGTNCKDLVYINLGEGISAGVILNDEILQGFQGHAGEIGHIVMVEGGPLCNCGNRGCLESLYGIPALLRRVNQEIALIGDDDPIKKIWKEKGKVSYKDLLNCGCNEGSYAFEILKQMAKSIGHAVAIIVNLLNPQMVFIGGKMSKGMELFLSEIRETVHSHSFPEIARTTTINISSFGKNSAVIGACALALRELFGSSDLLDQISLSQNLLV